MRILSPLLLGMMAMHAFAISLIYRYSFPNNLYEGSKSTTLITIVMLFLAICGLISIFLPSKIVDETTLNNKNIKWLLYIGGTLLLFGAWLSSTLFWYAPLYNYIGFDNPAPLSGVVCFLIFSLISSILLYLSSKYGSNNRPNLMRYLVILNSFTASILALTLVLILLYVFPSESGLVSYPTAATYCFISYIIWGGLILQMNREKIRLS